MITTALGRVLTLSHYSFNQYRIASCTISTQPPTPPRTRLMLSLGICDVLSKSGFLNITHIQSIATYFFVICVGVDLINCLYRHVDMVLIRHVTVLVSWQLHIRLASVTFYYVLQNNQEHQAWRKSVNWLTFFHEQS